MIEPEEISSFIDCGYMNNEIYVDYINRIFNSSLTIKIIFLVSAIPLEEDLFYFY